MMLYLSLSCLLLGILFGGYALLRFNTWYEFMNVRQNRDVRIAQWLAGAMFACGVLSLLGWSIHRFAYSVGALP